MARTPQPRLGYRWHLRRLMAEQEMFATTTLVPLLAERGVVLSEAQVYRLVTGTPVIGTDKYRKALEAGKPDQRPMFAAFSPDGVVWPDGSREEGGVTLYQPTGEKLFIYDAAINYMEAGTPTVIFAGEEYGTGSSRDWAAKGTMLLGIKAVIAKSFERIHRSNLIGMGVLPLQFKGGDSWQSLGLKGDETIEVEVAEPVVPQSDAALSITSPDGTQRRVTVTLRIDTPIEVDYYVHGGILPYVLRQLLAA